MKKLHGWQFPDHEKHLPEWMEHPKNQLVLNGRIAYQGRKQLAARELCKERRTAVDVGGHIGLWSFNLANWFDNVRAFEPVAEHRACFEANVPYDNVELHAIALGDQPGSVSMSTEDGSSGNTTVAGAGDIPMMTLDSVGLSYVDFIKIDCEGYEEKVLRGAVKTIERWRPVICVEQKRDMATRFGLKVLGAVEFLQERGYKVATEISGDYLMVPV